MRVLVVDDEAPARERLRRLVEDLPGFDIAGEAADGEAALDAVHAQAPEIVLLDVRMPDMDGIEAARHMAELDPSPAIVFVTAFDEHALDAFEVHAVDYLVKPVRRQRLEEALLHARRISRTQRAVLGETGAARSRLCARLAGELQIVDVDRVCYFLADRKYVTVRHPEGEILLEESLKALEREFGDRFLRIHRNALVAPAHVGGLSRSPEGRHNVWFRDIDDALEVSRRHLPGVRQRLNKGN